MGSPLSSRSVLDAASGGSGCRSDGRRGDRSGDGGADVFGDDAPPGSRTRDPGEVHALSGGDGAGQRGTFRGATGEFGGGSRGGFQLGVDGNHILLLNAPLGAGSTSGEVAGVYA